MEREKRVLIVAGEFPPYKSIGRIRSLKLCRHLPCCGWRPFVLTIGLNQGAQADPSTLEEIPPTVPVCRAAMPEPSRRITQVARKWLRGRNNSRASWSDGTGSGQAAQKATAPNWIGAAKAGFDRFAYKNLMIPDDWLFWILPAVNLGKKICRTNRIDLILTTAPPFSSILIGRWLKSATGIPWIVDYRDLWTGDVLRDWVPHWRRRLEIRLEKWALSATDAVVTVSEPKTAFMARRVTRLPKDRFVTVTNGYDPEEYEGLTKPPHQSDVLRMVYTGRLFKNRRGYELLRAAGQLFKEKPDLRPRLKVEYYGGVSAEIYETMQALITEYNLQSNFSFFPDVPYAKAKQLQVEADLLLLIVDTGETTSGVIPGKLFEYVAARTPILCIAEKGATSDIIERGRIGWVVKPGDIRSLQERLESLLSSVPLPLFAPDEDYLARYDRRLLVARMAGVMAQVASTRKSTSADS